MSVDLAYRRQHWLWVDQIANLTPPTQLILVSAGTYTGVLQNGLAVRNTTRMQDVNSQNVQGNPYGTALGLPTYQHYFTTEGTRYLFDLTDGSVYDLSAYDRNSLVVVWPRSF